MTLLTENQCDALRIRAGRVRSNRTEFECVCYCLLVQRLER